MRAILEAGANTRTKIWTSRIQEQESGGRPPSPGAVGAWHNRSRFRGSYGFSFEGQIRSESAGTCL